MTDLLIMGFGSLFFAGLLIVAADAVWYLAFLRGRRELRRYADGFVVDACLVCGGQLQILNKTEVVLGIAWLTRSVACDQCQSRLTGKGRKAWRWQVDQAANPELAWLYGGTTITDGELADLADGTHTQSAQAKLRELETQSLSMQGDRPAYRRVAVREALLQAIAEGDAAALAKFPEALIEAPPGIEVVRGEWVYTLLPLQKGERCLLVFRPAALGERRGRGPVTKKKSVLPPGQFVVTSQRYGYVSLGEILVFSGGTVARMQAEGEVLAVWRVGQREPEYYLGLDAALAEAAVRGIAGR